MDLNFWFDGGTPSDPASAVQLRLEGARAYGRVPGGDWEALDDQAVNFAPDNDPTIFLATTRNVRWLGVETRTLLLAGSDEPRTLTFQRYSYDIDRPALAKLMRERLEQRLREAGELPAGLNLGSGDIFRTIGGSGEVWLDTAGLPVRISADLEFPEQANGERITAQIVTDLHNYDQSRLLMPNIAADPLGWASHISGLAFVDAAGWRDLTQGMAAICLVLAAAAVLVRYAGSRRLYRAVALTLCAVIVLGPLFQARQVHAFNETQAERTLTQQAAEADAAQNRALTDELFASDWNPHADPLAVPPFAATAPVTPQQPGLPPNGDADGDGLRNADEVRIGTNPRSADSDEDFIPDTIEVLGFAPTAPGPGVSEDQIGHFYASGQLWYSDPNNPDSDGDGLLDSAECPERVPGNFSGSPPPCRDTDGDGVPDIFDLDNDNDGLINQVDFSPDRWVGSANTNITAPMDAARPFNERSPLGLVLSNLEAKRTVLVDLQLRPRDPKHLTYALNVLDWPSNDIQGQIQRTRTTTLPGTTGDLQLLPMLEVTIPFEQGRYGNLPIKPNAPAFNRNTPIENWLDKARLDEYRILPSQLPNGDIALYVPLSLVYDATGENRVGFTARMLYQPLKSDWGKAQQVRMVWAVLMLTDSCNSSKMPASVRDDKDEKVAEAWCQQQANRVENTSIVHRYFDDWYLTGMNVREELGTDTAILYEDPKQDQSETPDSLLVLTEQFSQVFLIGRDCEQATVGATCRSDKKRDITVAGMPERFDYTRNANLNPAARALGLLTRDPNGGRSLNVVRVDRQNYANQSAALIDLASNRVKRVLDGNFASAATQNPPLLMFAMESRYRTLNLSDPKQAQYRNGVLTLNAAGTKALVEASLHWKAYKRINNSWSVLPPAEYVDLLNVKYKQVFAELTPNEAPEVIAGQALMASMYHLTMYQGLSGFPEVGDRIIAGDPTQTSDIKLAQGVAEASIGAGKLVKKIVKWAVDREADTTQIGKLEKIALKFEEQLTNVRETIDQTTDRLRNTRNELYRALGSADDVADVGRMRGAFTKAQRLPGSVKAAYAAWKAGGTASPGLKKVRTGALVGTVAVTAYLFATSSGDSLQKVETVATGVALIFAIKTAYTAYEIYKGIQAFTRGAQVGAVVGLVVEVAAAVGLFLYTVIAAGLAIGGLAFNQLLADTIATIVVAVLLFALLFVPLVDQLLVAIIGLIDALIALICKAFNLEEKGTVLRDWVCKGISGIAAKIISKIFYGQTDIVVMTPGADAGYQRLDISGVRPPTLANPTAGIVAAQKLTFAHVVSNTLRITSRAAAFRKDPKTTVFYRSLFTASVLRSSTFAYVLQSRKNDLHNSLSRGRHSDEWSQSGDDFRLRRDVQTTFTLDNAGINQPLGGTGDLFLSEGFAYPVAECIILPVPPWSTCHVRTSKRTDHFPVGSNLFYDVFPATLTGFYEPGEIGTDTGGFAPKWGLNGTPAFTRQADFDGDGLRNRQDGGNDPDDSRFDTDGDVLPDGLEIARQTDPRKVDTDEDGLSDAYEVLVGTNPLRADTDGDGLTNREELSGWRFVYALDSSRQERFTLVTSDPQTVDSDGDALTDYQEFVLGTNPRTPTDPTVLEFNLKIREKDAPVALLRLDEVGGTWVYGNQSLNGSLANAICGSGECPVGGLSGYSGNGVCFDGPAQALTLPTLGLSAQLTLAAWINPEAADGNQPILASGDGQAAGVFLRLRDGFYEFGAVNGGIARAPVGTLSGWQHLAGSYDGATWRLFRDGTEIAQAPGGGDLRTLTGWAIGGYPAATTHFFRGAVDEVAIFAQGLDQTQVQATQARRYNLNDGIVRPGDTLLLQGSARNQLLGRYLQGLLRAVDPTGRLDTSSIPTRQLILQPNQGRKLDGEVRIPTTATTTQTTLNLVAGGQIVDVRVNAGEAQLWLTFDRLEGNETRRSFANQSGDLSVPPATCQGTTCPTLATDGRTGGAARFDGVDDLLTVASGASEGPYSFATWFRTTASNGGIFTVARDATVRGALDRRVYLQDGRICASVQSETICTANSYNDGAWHHLVHGFGGSIGAQQIYIDGTAQAQGTLDVSTAKDDKLLLIGRVADLPFFAGDLDDLRVLAQALPLSTIVNLAEKGPVVRNDFRFEDAPGYDEGGEAFAATGTTFLSSAELGTASVNYGSRFTLSLAIYPETTDLNRGIFGRLEGDDVPDGNNGIRSRPTLIQQGRQLEFRMGDGSRLVSFRTGDVLTANQWHLVMVTFDGQDLTIYVNGEVAGSSRDFAGMTNTLSDAGEVGRVSGRARIRVNSIEVLSKNSNANNEDYRIGGFSHNWYQSGPFENRLENPNNFILTRASVVVRGDYLPFALPFVGRVDELAIYDYAFTAERIAQATRAATSPLYLRLDDPTGSSGFANVNGVGNAGCVAPGCPIAGVPGRAGLAAQFDGNDRLVSDVVVNREALGVALWFKTTVADGGMFALANTADASGAQNGQIFLRGGQLCAQLNGSELCNGSGLNDGRWHHVVFTFNSSGAELVVDGAATTGAGGTLDLIGQNHAYIGAAPGTVTPFTGTLDMVQVFNARLDQATQARLRNSAPALKLGFDDASGSRTFVDDAQGNTGTCEQPRCPEQSIEARFGLAAGFDGTNDVVTVNSPFAAGVDYPQLTLEAWFNSEQPERQQFLMHQPNGFYLGLTAEGFLTMAITNRVFVSQLKPEANLWNHVAATYDGKELRLYLNGRSADADALAHSGAITPGSAQILIGAVDIAGGNGFQGRIEQATVYTIARPAFEIRDTFAIESRWFEQRVRYPITIDADKPTARLRLDGNAPNLRPLQAQRLLIEARDVGSRVMGVDWSIDGRTWFAAEPCRQAAGNGTLWCPFFDPQQLRGGNAEGRYSFYTRAFDLVDNQSDPTRVEFTLDGTGPNLVINPAVNSTLPVLPDPLRPDWYTVRISGSAADPNLADGTPGSGVRSVTLTLIDRATNLPLGQPLQRATLNGKTWVLHYAYPVERPNGTFTLEVIATDASGNSRKATRTLNLETTPPTTTLTKTNLPVDQLIGPRTLRGTASDPGTPASGLNTVEIAFKEYSNGSQLYNERYPDGALAIYHLDDSPDQRGALTGFDISGARRHATCIGAQCPVFGVDAPTGVGMAFDGRLDRLNVASFISGGDLSIGAWINPSRTDGTRTIVGRSDNALSLRIIGGTYRFGPINAPIPPEDRGLWVQLVGTVEGTTYRLYRNGLLFATATGTAPASGNAGWNLGSTGASNFFAGALDAVLIYGRTLTASEIATIYAGSLPRLLIDFEREFMRGGDLLADGAQRGTPIRLSSGTNDATNKATRGQVDHFALAFDGDDRVLAPFAAPGTAFSSAFWFRTQDRQAGLLSFTVNADGSGDYRGYYLRNGNICVYLSAAETLCSSGTNYADNAWHHVTHRFSSTSSGQQLFINGKLAATGTGTSFDISTQSVLLGVAGTAPLKGVLDEVRFYDRALNSHEIGALALAGWRTTTLSGSNWSSALPGGLEGNYLVSLRATDNIGNVEQSAATPWLWRGTFDTLSPRLTIARTTSGANATFTVTASDYNLNPATLVSPCGTNRPLTITSRSYYAAPWLAAITGRPISSGAQLVGLSATCTGPTAQATGTTSVRDRAGNSRTVTFGGASVSSLAELELPAVALLSSLNASITPAAPGNATLNLARTSFNRNDYHASGFIDLIGTATDADGVAEIILSSTSPVVSAAPARIEGADWSLPWFVGVENLPDQLDINTTFTVTNTLGEQTILNRTLRVGLRGPQIVTPTLTIAGSAFTPGMTVRTLNPQAVATIPALSDGSGVAQVWYGWLPSADPDQALLTSAASAPPTATQTLSNTPNPNSGAAWYFHLLAEDSAGNLSAASYGPVYYDPAPAPDYLSFAEADGPRAGQPYRGWLTSACSVLGNDERIAQTIPAGSALAQNQQLALTWDGAGMHLAWLGADWNNDGDLFIYFDSVSGGTNTAFDPHNGPTSVTLPSGIGASATPLAADYALWIASSAQISLLQWDGAAWQSLDLPDGLLMQHDPAAEVPVTDISLPFSALGLAGPSGTLDLVAFATEEAGPLRLWAAIPAANPLNSALVVRNAPAAESVSTLALTHRYRITLDQNTPYRNGFGIAEGGTCRRSADLVRFGVTETAGGMLYTPFDPSIQLAAPDPTVPDLRLRLADLLDNSAPPVVPSTLISYTISYDNPTTRALNNVYALVESSDLTFSGCNLLALGNLGAGARGSKTISGRSGSSDVGSVNVTLYASGQNGVTVSGCTLSGAQPGAEIAQFRVLYTEDNAAPVDVVITNVSELLPAGVVTLLGEVSDAAPVPTISIDVDGRATRCTDDTPSDGSWICRVDLSGYSDGTLVNISASATDVFGQTSAPSPLIQSTIDAIAPATVELDPALADTLNVTVGLAGMPTLYGSISDNRWAGPILACDADDNCDSGIILPDPADPRSGSWSVELDSYEELDNETVTYRLFGTDRVGNQVSDPLELSFTVDNVVPQISTTSGISLTGILEDRTDLRGTISDGGGIEQIYVTVVAPADEIYQLEHRNAGLHEVYVTGIDRSGNTNTLGPILVDVRPLNSLVADLSLTMAGPPNGQVAVNTPYTYTLTVTNNGPAPATDTVLTTTLDPGITLLAAETSVGSCDPSATPLCMLGTLAVSATASITLTAQISAVGTYRAIAQVESSLLEQITADNTARADVTAGLQQIYLPLITSQPAVPLGPDLEVESIRIVNGELLITISNTGTAAVESGFWVDLYINPTSAPTEVNETWEMLGTRGMVWGVTAAALPLAPGATLTLRYNDDWYVADRSRPGDNLAAGDVIYVQVDSVNSDDAAGGVRELHELDDGAYNNIATLTLREAVTLPPHSPRLSGTAGLPLR
jgi:uncharacterized repeat protein (TIGR01451 family)